MRGFARKALIGYMKKLQRDTNPDSHRENHRRRYKTTNLHLLEKISKKTNHHFAVGLFYTYEELPQNYRSIY